MAENQFTTMVIKVDLGCDACAKKTKKVLCKIPQIQNQIYDKKANTVTITVVCCSPEKIKQKIRCKGGETIKGIEIKVPAKPVPQLAEKPAPQPVPQPAAKPPPLPVPQPAPPPISPVRLSLPRTCCRECYEGGLGGPCFHGYGTPAAPPVPQPAPTPIALVRVSLPRTCCRECYEGRLGGPCFHGYGTPAAPLPVPQPAPPAIAPVRVSLPRTCCRECDEGGFGGPCFHGYGTPAAPSVCDSWGGGGCNCQRSGTYVCRCEYVDEDNRSSCIIM